MALLDVKGLCAGYGDVPVLRGIDLSIAAGSITALIGANGAGKTTLLRTISGIVPAEAGTISYDGRDIVGMPPQDIVRAGLVQVPEGRRLFSDMTVFENLLVGSSSPGARPRRDENLAMVLELFPRVRERRAQRAGTLSGGEQQMVAIARALMASPRLLLLDETSLGLGADRRRRDLRRGAPAGGAGTYHSGRRTEHRAGARSGRPRLCAGAGAVCD